MTTNNQPPLFQHQDDNATHGATGRATPPQRQRTFGRDWQPLPTPRTRPTGVTIIALLMGGTSALLGCLALFVLSELGGYAIIGLPLLAFDVWVAVGLWRLQAWARTAAIVLYVLGLVWSLLSLFTDALTVGSLIGFLIPIGIIYYLTRPHVAEAFQ